MIWSFFTKFTDQLHVNIPLPVSLFFRRSSLSLFLFSSSAASSASLSARRASRSFLRASLLLAASSYKEISNIHYCWISLPRKWKGGVMMNRERQWPQLLWQNYVKKLKTLRPGKLASWPNVRWYTCSSNGMYNRHVSFTTCIKPVTLSKFLYCEVGVFLHAPGWNASPFQGCSPWMKFPSLFTVLLTTEVDRGAVRVTCTCTVVNVLPRNTTQWPGLAHV